MKYGNGRKMKRWFCGICAAFVGMVIAAIMICIIFFSKNGDKVISPVKKPKDTETTNIRKINRDGGEEQKEYTKKRQIVARKDKKGNLKFTITIEDFIEDYNKYYHRDKGADYILPYSEWYSYIQDFGKHTGRVHYEYTADKKMWTLPTITIYTLQNEKAIRELTVNFDDHSYTKVMYQKYEELCFYTLKVFYPDLSDKKITKLYKRMNRLAYKNIFPNAKGFDSGNPPSNLFYREGIGVYPYFAYGESVRLCFVPVTPKVIHKLEKRGTIVHCIE